jgi:hypothetical protein
LLTYPNFLTKFDTICLQILSVLHVRWNLSVFWVLCESYVLYNLNLVWSVSALCQNLSICIYCAYSNVCVYHAYLIGIKLIVLCHIINHFNATIMLSR